MKPRILGHSRSVPGEGGQRECRDRRATDKGWEVGKCPECQAVSERFRETTGGMCNGGGWAEE